MSKANWWAILLCILAPLAWAQDESDNEDDETEIDISGGAVEGPFDIRIDPFEEDLEPAEEPNRPAPVRVGTWTPPPLGEDARRELDSILAERGAHLEDAGARYRLADFYLEHGWFQQAEAEYLSCAQLEPQSIRPWEGLLRVYRGDADRIARERENDDALAQLPPGIPPAIRRQLVNQMRGNQPRPGAERDWLPSEKERQLRVTRAYEEILKRRADDIARRRELLAHLHLMRDYPRVAVHARAILERLPNDAVTRYELAEAIRRDGFLRGNAKRTTAEQLRNVAALDDEADSATLLREAEALEKAADEIFEQTILEVMPILEENVKRAPEHAPSALRLVRMLAARDGYDAIDRILELQRRGFFHLFCRSDLAPVPYRRDTLDLARKLAGPRLAARLWDAAMKPPEVDEIPVWRRKRRYYDRWIDFNFGDGLPKDRREVIAMLARRADQAAMGTLIAFLWHVGVAEEMFSDNALEQRANHKQLVASAIDTAAAFGGLCYPAAERFLTRADTSARRRRGVALVRALRDPRAVTPLIDVLAGEVGENSPDLGIAAALEELGDARAIDALVAAAMDVRRPVALRRNAAEALAIFDDPRSVETLNSLAKEGEFRLVTAYGLFRLNGDADALGRIRETLSAGGDECSEVLRMVAKWAHPRFEGLLLEGLRSADPEVRSRLYSMLKERYWKTAQDKAEAALLEAAGDPKVPDWIVTELGAMGGEEAAKRLGKLLDLVSAERWELVATAYARTGDPRAVRFFNRMRILEKNEARRRLARTLHKLAAASKASREREADD